MEAIGPNIPWTLRQAMDGKSFHLQNDLERMFSRRDSHRGEPDALTAHVRFWEGAKLNRPCPSFMLSLEERASSTHPELPIGRFLKSKSLGGNRVILVVTPLNAHHG
jgi:hypothetical protein